MRNGLRHRIEVRTDGGLKTGRDVVIAALLGAESYGFGTAPLVAMGCAMAQQCHINTCPTGIATQREDLRAKFKGTPEQVITYFTLVAEEVRRILAGWGSTSLEEVIGRNDLLERVERPEVPRAQMLDLSLLLAPTDHAGQLGSDSLYRDRGAERPAGPGVARRGDPRRAGAVSRERSAVLGQLPDPQPPPRGGRPGLGRHRRAGRRRRTSARIGSAPLHGRAGQSFGAFLLEACIWSSRARPTTTSARD